MILAVEVREHDFMREERRPFKGVGAVGVGAADKLVLAVGLANQFGVAELADDLVAVALGDEVFLVSYPATDVLVRQRSRGKAIFGHRARFLFETAREIARGKMFQINAVNAPSKLRTGGSGSRSAPISVRPWFHQSRWSGSNDMSRS